MNKALLCCFARWQLIYHVPKHSEEMKTKAHDLVFEYVNSDPGPDLSNLRITYPKWGFGQRQRSDSNWLKLVWQYCRLPHDMSDDIKGRTELNTRPDSKTFLMHVFLPEGTTWKRALGIMITDNDTKHSNFMLKTALNCLAYTAFNWKRRIVQGHSDSR
jgi:hypothetical protein